MGASKYEDEVADTVLAASSILRGTVNVSEHRDYILPILFLRMISDVYDQWSHGDLPLKSTQYRILDKLNWTKSRNNLNFRDFYRVYENRKEAEIGDLLNDTFAHLERSAYAELGGVFSLTDFNSQRLGDRVQRTEILSRLLECIARISFAPVKPGPTEVAYGDLFTSAMETLAWGRRNTVQLTPTSVSKLVAELVSTKPRDSIYDPACGSGSMLIACVEQLLEGDISHPRLFGSEKNGTMWSLARMNSFLHGEDGRGIVLGDPLQSEPLTDVIGEDPKFDVVVSNPPWGNHEWRSNRVTQYAKEHLCLELRGKLNSDYAYILYMMSVLDTTQGRMAVVVPNGTLSKSGNERSVRRRLIEENLLDAVIALPEKLFFDTSIPVSILLIKSNKETAGFLFVNAAKEFYTERNHNHITAESIGRIVNTIATRTPIFEYSYLASREEVKSNDFDWNINSYVKPRDLNTETDLDALRTRRDELQERLLNVEASIARKLDRLNITS